MKWVHEILLGGELGRVGWASRRAVSVLGADAGRLPAQHLLGHESSGAVVWPWTIQGRDHRAVDRLFALFEPQHTDRRVKSLRSACWYLGDFCSFADDGQADTIRDTWTWAYPWGLRWRFVLGGRRWSCGGLARGEER